MRVEGDRVVLRRLDSSDARSLYLNANDYKVARYTYVPYPYRLEYAREYIRKTRKLSKQDIGYQLGIELKETGEIIGVISLINFDYEYKSAEVAYWIGRGYWGQGLAKEAVQLILDLGFNQLKLKRIHARVMHPNIASARVLEKCGFKLEGRLRKTILRNNKWLDEFRYSILREEFS